MSVCALPDGLALIWELGRGTLLLLLRVRTHNVGHKIRKTGSLTWEFCKGMLLRFRKHNIGHNDIFGHDDRMGPGGRNQDKESKQGH